MKNVYLFCRTKTEGTKEMKDLLGGKGANLAEMSNLSLPVPPGFTISTEACLDYYKGEQGLGEELKKEVLAAIETVQKETSKVFGSDENPLLFSVRSGARVSMPGMMDTVLNLGMNDKTVEGMAKKTGNPRFAWDSYRRFIQMFANVVMGLNTSLLEGQLEDLKEARGVTQDQELSWEDLKELVAVYKSVLLEDYGKVFPQDAHEQLWLAVEAVFSSWNNSRAIKYRDLNGFSHEWGTAVNVQSMVFGNTGDNSGTGVCFTRNPSTGENIFFGEFLLNAQGEDVVAGIRTPQPINNSSKNNSNQNLTTLEEALPPVYGELVEVYKKLEAHYKDMQDIEFTIEEGNLFLLQTRSGKRTVNAALKIATDFVQEGIIDKEEALMRIKPADLDQLLHPRLDPAAEKELLAAGLPASPGAASGKIVFHSADAVSMSEAGEDVILVRQETSPEDIAGMYAAAGILTARGGMTSHAAVVARGMGKPCVAGCSALEINESDKILKVAERTYQEGDILTFDGSAGEIYHGSIATLPASLSGEFQTLMTWADEKRRLRVRANADNPEDAQVALDFGAEGIGLCRTEHMFFAPERVLAVRQMIFARDLSERQAALEKITPFQKSDFISIFIAMKGLPVNIRLLDPPLHEFLPHQEHEQKELAESLNLELAIIQRRMEELHEFNPMLGHRGARLGVTYPEIYRMQVQAIVEAAIDCEKQGIKVKPEIMLPLISDASELAFLKDDCKEVIDELINKSGLTINYKLGTMLELPRACLTADKVAEHADFFSFGTNDLTQTTYGLSRDDSGKFLGFYKQLGLYPNDPFVALDQEGVGALVKMATEKGRSVKSDLSIGICGEHGGEPSSIDFSHRVGLDYVSCSPFRVPVARLSAAQSAITNKN